MHDLRKTPIPDFTFLLETSTSPESLEKESMLIRFQPNCLLPLQE
jgi:hypothetical protein